MDKLYDAVIVGGGPAGLTAAIYMARARYHVLVIEKEKFGGQITITSEVVNYPGILETNGTELTESMREQAENFGADFLSADVLDLDLSEDIRVVKTSRGDIKTLGIVLATGASPRSVGFTGEEEFKGRGVAYCATCDGEFFTGMDVFVVGGGFAAAEEAMFLTKYAKKVTILVREPDFTCARSIVEEVLSHPEIEVRYQSEILEAGGEEHLEYAVIRDNASGETYRYEAEPGKTFGIFVFVGYAPATGLFKDKVQVSEAGYLITDRNQKTSVDGVYGAGDVCVKELRQVVTAVSDGAVAGTSLEKYMAAMYKKLNLPKRNERIVKKPKAKVEVETSAGGSSTDDGFITDQMKAQLAGVFGKFESHIILKGYVASNEIGQEVKGFLAEVSDLTDKVNVELHEGENVPGIATPSIYFCDSRGTYLGTQFHGVPGGHEFNSFIIALYNAAGPGQMVGEEDVARMKAIKQKMHVKVVVSLSCTMCPDLVMAAQKIALDSEHVEVEVFDLSHFPDIKDQYNIMSVPCFIITNVEANKEKVYFGKKNIGELLTLIEDNSK